MLVFETDRLRAHQVQAGDETSFLAVYGDPISARWVGDGKPITPEECALWVKVTLRNYERYGYGMYRLSKDENQLIGFCGLVHPGEQKEVELKYSLLRKHWGNGYATEAVTGILDYAKTQLGIHSVIATVASDNQASRNVLEKHRFVYRETIIEDDGSNTLLLVRTAD